MNLLHLSLKLKGFPIAKAQDLLTQIQSLSPEAYSQYLTQKKAEILEFHLSNNAYYRSLAGSVNANDWEQIPVLTKAHLQRPLRERLSQGYTPSKVYVNKTSGSSGHPFVFAKDKFCHALTWATIYDRVSWHNLDVNNDLQARFYGIPLDTVGYAKERLKDALSGRLRFPIFDLQDDELEAIYQTFSQKEFVYINGYTSSIVLFAKYLKRRQLNLKLACPTLMACVVTSEMLFESDKILMESVLGVPVINEYGASELDLIAFTHPTDGFRVNSESLFVEILDPEGQPLPAGKEGSIVITSLYNKAHPFIRYDIGDIGALSPNSTPHKPILDRLVGRTNDIALLPSGKTVPGLTFYYVTKSIIEDDGMVQEFIIEQMELDTFLIHYVSLEALPESKIAAIKKALETYLEPGLTLHFERLAVLKRTARGKLKQFVSHL